jgi:hypothetical protein
MVLQRAGRIDRRIQSRRPQDVSNLRLTAFITHRRGLKSLNKARKTRSVPGDVNWKKSR